MTVTLHLVRDRAQNLALSWNFNPRYPSQRQTAFQIRRQAKNGSGVRYRSASNQWVAEPQTIVSTATSYTITPTWQGSNDIRYYFVRVRDEEGVWSTWSAALEVDTTLALGTSHLVGTSPADGTQVGQLPVITWDAADQVSFELRVTEPPHGDGDVIWSQEEIMSGARRATLFVPNSHNSNSLRLWVRIRDKRNRQSMWEPYDVVSSFAVRQVPTLHVAALLSDRVVVRLVVADATVSRCVIERRFAPSGVSSALAAGVSDGEIYALPVGERSGASDDDLYRRVVVFEGDYAPNVVQPFSDWTVRYGVAYEYRMTLEWDSDETRAQTDWTS